MTFTIDLINRARKSWSSGSISDAKDAFELALETNEPLAHYWAAVFYEEIGYIEKSSYHLNIAFEAKFGPAVVRVARRIKSKNIIARFSDELLDDLKSASEQGYLQAEFLYRQNYGEDVTILGFIPHILKLRRLKRKIEKELSNNGWSDPKYWG